MTEFIKSIFFKKSGRDYFFSPAFLIIVFFTLLALDQALKNAAFFGNGFEFLNYFAPVAGKKIFYNYNFAFSLKLAEMWMWTVYAAIMFLTGLYVFKEWKKLNELGQIAWVLILAGAGGNLIERMYLGYVRDFILILNGIFNFSDFYIIVGVGILLLGGVGIRIQRTLIL